MFSRFQLNRRRIYQTVLLRLTAIGRIINGSRGIRSNFKRDHLFIISGRITKFRFHCHIMLELRLYCSIPTFHQQFINSLIILLSGKNRNNKIKILYLPFLVHRPFKDNIFEDFCRPVCFPQFIIALCLHIRNPGILRLQLFCLYKTGKCILVLRFLHAFFCFPDLIVHRIILINKTRKQNNNKRHQDRGQRCN